jgi:hypothetical protein
MGRTCRNCPNRPNPTGNRNSGIEHDAAFDLDEDIYQNNGDNDQSSFNVDGFADANLLIQPGIAIVALNMMRPSISTRISTRTMAIMTNLLSMVMAFL